MNKMKITLSFLTAGLLAVTGLNAQSLQDGVKDLYAERTQSAKAIFEKLLASNPSNNEATYWLGQTYLANDDVEGAKAVYDKGLTASNNAPLIVVGRGQVDLEENKIAEARQRFEAAITASRGKKGDDPQILNAVGRAITNVYDEKEKKGDINYAVEKLEAAAQEKTKDKWLQADIYTNLGNALRKAKPGENGGKAFENYQKANMADPSYAYAYLRTAQLFESQKNWELFEQNLNKAIEADPKYAPAYYQLSYYKMGRLDLASAKAFAQKYKENSDNDPQNSYLEYSIDWAAKNYDQAINGAKGIIAQTGGKAKARVYKLIAYAYLDKKDTAAGREYVDEYFKRAKPEEITALDYKLKADIYSALPGQEQALYAIYMEGVKADTSVENKVRLLDQGAEFFKNKGLRELEGDMTAELLKIKPKPTINDWFDAGRAYYFGKAYVKSYGIFDQFVKIYPDSIYGYEWKLNNAKLIDTVKKDSIAVPDALTLLEFSKRDSVRYASQISSAAYYLVTYYAAKNERDKVIEYLEVMKSATTNPDQIKQIQSNIDALTKQPTQQPATKPRGGTSAAGSR
ncbi:tetratricopeptide repeat protein [Nostoc ellipsosporum NOK]|jgi:Tfp pilus assembly protein PilF|nr:tetratricopeptide repeat protein [Nostoc ellipsosporum NOK]